MRPSNPLCNVALFKNLESVAIAPQLAKTDRPELGKLMRRLEEGDTVIVCRLDRLARSTRESAQRARRDQQARRWLQVAEGQLGRHDQRAWSVDADHSRRPGRVRA